MKYVSTQVDLMSFYWSTSWVASKCFNLRLEVEDKGPPPSISYFEFPALFLFCPAAAPPSPHEFVFVSCVVTFDVNLKLHIQIKVIKRSVIL